MSRPTLADLPPPPSYEEIIGKTPEELAALLEGDPRQAAQLLLAGARYGLVEAQTTYAQLLLDGRGVRRDPASAFAWFKVAAGAGSADATNMLGRCHELGWGVPPDTTQAARLYREAAERGLDWGQYNLANLLARGDGLALDREAALGWYVRAARQGHAKSMNLVGRFLEEGWGISADPMAAQDWYRRAAEGGDFRGQFNHASVLVRRGEVGEAVLWYRQAVAGGTSGFLRSMAQNLIQQPQPELRVIAMEILVSCRESGEPADLFAYGRALLPTDAAEARRWLGRAAAMGHAEARTLLNGLGLAGRWAIWRAYADRFTSAIRPMRR
ncbi:MAG: Sel1 protein [Rubritepida sp.]|nr:Sel1 protein [Rubritepida sp.]